MPEIFANQETEADLLLLVDIFNDSSGYLAFAAPCNLNGYNYRPNIGMVRINNKKFNISQKTIRQYFYILLHEIFHILVFSPTLYDKYVSSDSNTKVDYEGILHLTTNKLIETAKTHFSCSDMESVKLENEGNASSANSHFEKFYFGNEIMTSQLTGDPVISSLTLSLMEDSGWYQVNYQNSQTLSYGSQSGCGFLQSDCQSKED